MVCGVNFGAVELVMPREIRLSTDHWELLADLHPHHKTLYTLMYLKADEAGVVTRALKDFSGMAGYEYSESDIRALGDWVKVMPGGAILIPDYLRQQYSTLSYDARGQAKMWMAIRHHWGKRQKDGVEPFIAAWKALGVGGKVPEFKEHYNAGQETVPPWVKARGKDIALASAVPIPASWPKGIRDDFRQWCLMREEMALNQTSKQDLAHYQWDGGRAVHQVAIIQRWLDEGYPPLKIGEAINAAYQGSYTSIHAPRISKYEQQNVTRNRTDE